MLKILERKIIKRLGIKYALPTEKNRYVYRQKNFDEFVKRIKNNKNIRFFELK